MSDRRIVEEAVKNGKTSKKILFRSGLISGLGWAFGVTIGFALVATILIVLMNKATTLPWVGDTLADVIEVTQEQLLKRSIITTPELTVPTTAP